MLRALILAAWTFFLPAAGQGFLEFRNNLTNRDGFKALILDLHGIPVPREHGRVAISVKPTGPFVGPIPPPFRLGSPADGTGVAFTDDGIFDLGILAIPGYPAEDYLYYPSGTDFAFSIVVWDRRYGATFEETPSEHRASFRTKLRRLGSRPEEAPDLVAGTDFSGIQLGIGPWPSGQVDLHNYNVYQGEMTFIRDPELRPLSKAVGRVEFFLVGSGQPSLLRFASPEDGTGNPLRDDGLFWMGYTHVPTTKAGHAYFLLMRAWDSSTGGTFDTATTKWESLIGHSSFGPYLGGNGLPIPRIHFIGLQLMSLAVPATITSTTDGRSVRISAEVTPGLTYRLLTSWQVSGYLPYYQFEPPMPWEESGTPVTSQGRAITWTVPVNDAQGFFRVIHRK